MHGDGEVRKAGEGVSDEEMAAQVRDQTDSELRQAEVFKQESDGTKTDEEAAKAYDDKPAEER